MDLGSMTKKLKQISYKSKKEFVDDLNLIWANCLRYNADPTHFLRRHALAMRKETEKLVPLIPDIIIRDRAEVEAEERRLQAAAGEVDGGEDSDDEPIMSSRGRKAPGKQAKKGATKKEGTEEPEGTPSAESKPNLHLSTSSTNLKHELLRGVSDIDGSQNGLSTPPLPGTGTATPGGLNGHRGSLPPGSQTDDAMDIDHVGGLGMPNGGEVDIEDAEYRTWKMVTKKDRARVAAERNRLFKGDRLQAEEPALLRTKAGMRRWTRLQKQALKDNSNNSTDLNDVDDVEETKKGGETLAEGMEGQEEQVLPDYYDALSAIPELSEQLKWTEDSDGNVIINSEYLRMVPKGQFTLPESELTTKMEANMRQMQETRKIVSKIGVIKQMQLQQQVNNLPKRLLWCFLT
jgi:transcriptional activator SPT7